ncbi:ATP-binding protein [Desulfobacula sp.]|uniref:ATP-binding protein n=1 Tax=Desulfobacula sp. TaxID=2593537 RepID=UPI002619CF0A|nr:ATP-binding protein [Desulfobacula sp.]
MEIVTKNRGKGLSFGTKLAIVFLFIAILPMSIVSYYSLVNCRQELGKFAGSELISLSRATAYSIDQLLLENQRNSATLAGFPLAIQFLSRSVQDREALIPRIHQEFENYLEHHPDWNTPGFMDAKGIIQVVLDKNLVGEDRSYRNYFHASMNGSPFISDILLGRVTRKPGIFLTHPVKTKQGKILGINVVWLKADPIWDIIDHVKVGKKGIGYLIDHEGVIIAHPHRELLYHSLGDLHPDVVSTISSTFCYGTVQGTTAPYLPERLGMESLAAHIAVSQDPDTFRYFSPRDHQYHVVGYFPLEKKAWTVVVDLPESQFLAPLKRLEKITYMSIGAVVIISILISFFLSRNFSRPIRSLTTAAAGIKSGRMFDPDTIADITSGKDEIACLGRAFSSMVQSLQQSEEKYRILVENSPDIIYRTDLDGIITFISSSVYRLSGYAVSEAIGMKITDSAFFNLEEKALFLYQLQQTDLVNDFEAQLKRKDGTVWWASINSYFTMDKDGKRSGVEGIVRDITERREKEHAQREWKAAQAANHAKSVFLATMSHEIRTPLNVLLGFIELLSVDLKNPRQERYLDAMKLAGKSLLTLINDILDISKIEAGKMGFIYAPVNLDSVFAEIESIFNEKISGKGIGFEVDLPEDPSSPLMLDKARIRQILLNLVGNAAKFTEKGRIKLSAQQQPTQDPDRIDLTIRVEDTGPGIEKNALDSIFESFKQVDGTINRHPGGTGLGLAICKKLTEAMNGQIRVTSQTGLGSTFFVCFKDVQRVSDSIKKKIIAEPADNRCPSCFEKKKILVVDDIESNRFMIRELLIRFNQDVVEAGNGQEALMMAKENPPDLIIMDTRMPVMDGDQATRLLKLDAHTKHIPIIAFTGDVVSRTRTGGVKKGYDGYLTKPIKVQDLTDELSKYIKRVNS